MADRRTTDHIDVLRDEIADLDAQVEAGDIDVATADALRTKYSAELTALESSTVAGSPDEREAGDAPDPAAGRPRLSGRSLAGAAVLGLAIVAIGIFAATSLDDGTSGVEGVASDVVAGGTQADLSEISNEEMETVVAANPEVIGMRLALARRYFEEGSFDRALGHYFAILEREQHPEALANVGWMTYLSQRPDIALGYLEASLERQPDYLPAQWFLANVLVTLDRSDEAIPYLVALADSSEVPQEIKDGVVALLAQIEEAP